MRAKEALEKVDRDEDTDASQLRCGESGFLGGNDVGLLYGIYVNSRAPVR